MQRRLMQPKKLRKSPEEILTETEIETERKEDRIRDPEKETEARTETPEDPQTEDLRDRDLIIREMRIRSLQMH